MNLEKKKNSYLLLNGWNKNELLLYDVYQLSSVFCVFTQCILVHKNSFPLHTTFLYDYIATSLCKNVRFDALLIRKG